MSAGERSLVDDLPADHDQAAAYVVSLATAKWEAVKEIADAAGVDAALLAGRVQDNASAAFKRRFYPRRTGRVVAAEQGVYLQSPTGRVKQVYAAPGWTR